MDVQGIEEAVILWRFRGADQGWEERRTEFSEAGEDECVGACDFLRIAPGLGTARGAGGTRVCERADEGNCALCGEVVES